MRSLNALSVSIGILGGLATWGFLAVGSILIWAAFIAWACFFLIGGDNALRSTIAGNLYGCLLGWIAAVLILAVPIADRLTQPIWAGIVVGVTAWGLCYVAHIKAFSVIPANVLGYAATFAFLLQTPDKLSLSSLLSFSLNNSLVVVSVSMIIGAILGLISAKVAVAMTTQEG